MEPKDFRGIAGYVAGPLNYHMNLSWFSPCRGTVRVVAESVSWYSPCRGSVRVVVESVSW